MDEDFLIPFEAVIDETTAFTTKRPRLSQRVVFDCREVKVVNSFGMHLWMQWMRALPPETQYVFRHCRRKVIDMMNSVEGFFTENAVVESFYMPYHCEQCDADDEILLTRGKDFIESVLGQKPRLLYSNQLNCSQCRSSMEIGVIENIYLRFLQR